MRPPGTQGAVLTRSPRTRVPFPCSSHRKPLRRPPAAATAFVNELCASPWRRRSISSAACAPFTLGTRPAIPFRCGGRTERDFRKWEEGRPARSTDAHAPTGSRPVSRPRRAAGPDRRKAATTVDQHPGRRPTLGSPGVRRRPGPPTPRPDRAAVLAPTTRRQRVGRGPFGGGEPPRPADTDRISLMRGIRVVPTVPTRTRSTSRPSPARRLARKAPHWRPRQFRSRHRAAAWFPRRHVHRSPPRFHTPDRGGGKA